MINLSLRLSLADVTLKTNSNPWVILGKCESNINIMLFGGVLLDLYTFIYILFNVFISIKLIFTVQVRFICVLTLMTQAEKDVL